MNCPECMYLSFCTTVANLIKYFQIFQETMKSWLSSYRWPGRRLRRLSSTLNLYLLLHTLVDLQNWKSLSQLRITPILVKLVNGALNRKCLKLLEFCSTTFLTSLVWHPHWYILENIKLLLMAHEKPTVRELGKR